MSNGFVKRFLQDFVIFSLPCHDFLVLMVDFVKLDTKRITYITMKYSMIQVSADRGPDGDRLISFMELV